MYNQRINIFDYLKSLTELKDKYDIGNEEILMTNWRGSFNSIIGRKMKVQKSVYVHVQEKKIKRSRV